MESGRLKGRRNLSKSKVRESFSGGEGCFLEENISTCVSELGGGLQKRKEGAGRGTEVILKKRERSKAGPLWLYTE